MVICYFPACSLRPSCHPRTMLSCNPSSVNCQIPSAIHPRRPAMLNAIDRIGPEEPLPRAGGRRSWWRAWGSTRRSHLPIDAVPDLTNVQVQVITEAPALSPLEVETLLSFPVEGAMSGLPNVEQIRSISKFGISVVTIVFHEGTDIYRARQLVGERLAARGGGDPAGLRHADARPDRHGAGRGLPVPGQGDQGVGLHPDGAADDPRLVRRLPVPQGARA